MEPIQFSSDNVKDLRAEIDRFLECRQGTDFRVAIILAVTGGVSKAIAVFGDPAEEEKSDGAEVTGITPSCPKCGAPMVLRKSRYGNNFWGCPKFPRCRGTLSLAAGKSQQDATAARSNYSNPLRPRDAGPSVDLSDAYSGAEGLPVDESLGMIDEVF